MQNVILDVVIDLVLIYGVFSLLVMGAQEFFAGALLRGRVTVLHRLLREATGQDAELKKRLLANPLVDALSQGKVAREGIPMLLPPRGPSKVPPDVFARALLMEVDATEPGKPPTERFSTPQAFVDSLLSKTDRGQPSARIVTVLRGLLVGREADWPSFEAAVGNWYAHIGDRSDGWFKRRSTWFTLGIAGVLATLLNIDTINIARALGSDGELRSGLAAIAQQVVAQRELAAQPPTLAPGRAREKPEAQITTMLSDAGGTLLELYNTDAAITKFERGLVPVHEVCPIYRTAKAPDAASVGATPQRPPARALQGTKAERSNVVGGKFVSDAQAWVEILPLIEPQIERALAGKKEGDKEPNEVLDSAHRCLVHVSKWVSNAKRASEVPATRRSMEEVSATLTNVKSALLELAQRRDPPRALVRLFHSAPDDFKDCARTGTTLQEVSTCAEQRQDIVTRLPIGLTPRNLLLQLCDARAADKLETLLRDRDSGVLGLCIGQVDARPELGLQAMVLTAKPAIYSGVSMAAGLLITTLFALIGAPFWFDLLGKVVKVRSAGSGAGKDDMQKAAGTTSLLPPPNSTGPSSAPTTTAGPPTGPANPNLNGFEAKLTKREIVALQQRLSVKETGEFDMETRSALKDALGGDAGITPINYQRLLGRPAIASEDIVVSGLIRPQLRQAYAGAQPLAKQLMVKLQFDGRIAATETMFSDALRALVVLYRFKNDKASSKKARGIFDLARRSPNVLNEADESLVDDILSPTARIAAWDRETAPWLDWAIGETGQVENNANNRKASNPRICEYLDAVAANMGNAGDTTPWCGAFVTWVITQHNSLLPSNANALEAPPKEPGLAASWAAWGSDASAAPQAGDVVVVKSADSASGHHVGWCFDIDQQTVVLLGGNQATGGRVCLSSFPRGAIDSVRRG